MGMLVTAVIYRLARARRVPLVASQFHWPEVTRVDRPLVAGSILFGAGWAMGGYCPGPALVAAGALRPEALVFVLAMLAGGFAHRFWSK
jgi:uncharacterized membrane protein YedE/YeeE